MPQKKRTTEQEQNNTAEQSGEKGQQTVQPTLDEQMMRRMSAPRPTVEEEAEKLYRQQQAMTNTPALDGFKAISQVIGKEQIQKATLTLQKYREGKKNLETKIIDNEQWYKLRHWECMRDKKSEVQPASGWLFNCIENKHADAMDNFPSPNILPREDADKGEAKMLSSIVPVILEQNGFEEVYDEVQRNRIKSGTGVYGIFWDSSLHNGLGDVSIKEMDVLNLFWEPGITDIQKSKHFFSTELVDNESLEQTYPQLAGKLGSKTVDVAEYQYDDSVDTTDKSLVIDWYYKKINSDGRQVLHYCKYVNDFVLFATENEDGFAERGLYDHGKYPFRFDVCFPMKGTPCGFGYIDVAKDSQAYIDRMNQAISMNALASARPRYFSREDGGVNEAEFTDYTKSIVHVEGNLNDDNIRPIDSNQLGSVYLEVLNRKVDELKETTGNRDIATGGTTSGVTAASAIAAMQEAGSKLSRDANKASYRAYRDICLMVIELIRQFYDLPRCFRIVGENGAMQFVQYSNENIVAQYQGQELGIDMGHRLPLFDVEVTAQKASPYSKMAQNELALQLLGAGFFNPQMADQSLACLEIMDFPGKESIMQRIAQNGGMYQQLLIMQQQMLAMAQEVDKARGTNLAEQMASGITGGSSVTPGVDPKKTEETEALGGDETQEASNTKKARQRVAESTSPT